MLSQSRDQVPAGASVAENANDIGVETHSQLFVNRKQRTVRQMSRRGRISGTRHAKTKGGRVIVYQFGRG
jgi:predicted ATPase